MRKNNTPENTNNLLTVEEAAEIVGCSVQNIYGAIKSTALEYYVFLGRKVVSPEQLSKWRAAYSKNQTTVASAVTKEIENVELSINKIKKILNERN